MHGCASTGERLTHIHVVHQPRTMTKECRQETAENVATGVLCKPTGGLLALCNPLFNGCVEMAVAVGHGAVVHCKLVHDSEAVKPVAERKGLFVALARNVKHAWAVLFGQHMPECVIRGSRRVNTTTRSA